MIVNIITILIITIISIGFYRRNYYAGMFTSIFFLVLLPDNLAIEISVAIPSISIHRILIVLMFVFWYQNKELKFRRFIKSPFGTILILLACSKGLSVLLSDYFIVSLKQYLYFIFESLIFYMIVFTSLIEYEQVKRLIVYVAYGLLVVAMIGIIQKYTGFDVTGLFGEQLKSGNTLFFESSINVNDVFSTYPHRILFGTACSIGLIYYLFIAEIFNKKKLILYLSTLAISSALYFSNSRGPWLSFILSLGLITFINPKVFMKKSILLSAVVLLVFFVRPGTYETINSLFESTLDPNTLKGSSYRWRFSVVEVALDKITDADLSHFMFGFGPGVHLYTDPVPVDTSTGHESEMLSWDCEYAIILFENGFVGMILFMYLYFKLSILTLFNVKRHPEEKLVLLLAFASMFVIMFMKTNVSFFSPQLVYVEYINITIISYISIQNRQRLPRHGMQKVN